MIRDSMELQAIEDGADAAVTEARAFDAFAGIEEGRGGEGREGQDPDPAAALRSYLSRIDR